MCLSIVPIRGGQICYCLNNLQNQGCTLWCLPIFNTLQHFIMTIAYISFGWLLRSQWYDVETFYEAVSQCPDRPDYARTFLDKFIRIFGSWLFWCRQFCSLCVCHSFVTSRGWSIPSSLHGTPQKSLFYILLVAGGAHGGGHGASASAVERLLVRPKG